ncbi:TAXI family TRAP transporter solute-binding subunit [Streptomyces sp. NPDC050619]|uniref:TAXI family TRAP transporter solute-binding subunit n=1 Tax=Streptomyces sp. NPDC050619 TaxID=3157214 RepID=UPI0034250AFC
MLKGKSLTIIADWGNANFHAIAGWIAANVRFRIDGGGSNGTQHTILTGSGYRENVEAVANGTADIAITTPADITLEMAVAGRDFFAGTPYPHLRTLGYIPQDDRLVFAVRADTGIESFADIREKRPALTIATATRDEANLMTYVIMEVLRSHGIDPADIEAWGGRWLEHDHPRRSLEWAINGEANAVINEAILVPQWWNLVETVPMRFIPMEEEALDDLTSRLGVRRATLERGRLGAETDVPCLDWSNWAIVVRDDMPDEMAHMITAVMVEERAELEARYRHLPYERSPLSYPIDPYTMHKGLGAPLHPGAERYYRDNGYLS